MRFALPGKQVGGERLGGNLETAIGLGAHDFRAHRATRNTRQRHDQPVIIEFLKRGDATDATGLPEPDATVLRALIIVGVVVAVPIVVRRLHPSRRLDDGDHAAARQRIVKHLEIARLENIERQPCPWQQDAAPQRKHRQHGRQIAEAFVPIGDFHLICLTRSHSLTAIQVWRHENSTPESLRRPSSVA